MTDGFALKSWVVDLINKAFKKNGLRYNGIPVELQYQSTATSIDLANGDAIKSLIPLMTSYTSPSGKVTSSGDWSDSYAAYRAFNNRSSTGYGYYPSNSKWLNSWCQYESESPITFNTIIATSFNLFNLQYDIMVSNDGKSWTTVGTIPIDAQSNKWNVLNIPSTTSKFIRFKCITNNSDNRGAGIFIKNM